MMFSSGNFVDAAIIAHKYSFVKSFFEFFCNFFLQLQKEVVFIIFIYKNRLKKQKDAPHRIGAT